MPFRTPKKVKRMPKLIPSATNANSYASSLGKLFGKRSLKFFSAKTKSGEVVNLAFGVKQRTPTDRVSKALVAIRSESNHHFEPLASCKINVGKKAVWLENVKSHNHTNRTGLYVFRLLLAEAISAAKKNGKEFVALHPKTPGVAEYYLRFGFEKVNAKVLIYRLPHQDGIKRTPKRAIAKHLGF